MFTLFSALLVAAACQRRPSVQRVLPGVPTGDFAELSESALDAIVICHDTLGRPSIPGRRVQVSRCSPCIPYGMQASAARAAAHARRLWLQGARAPYDSSDVGAECVRLAYTHAQALSPDDESLAVERALVELANVRASSRARALLSIDSILQDYVSHGYQERAARLLSQLALGILDRAQRQLERPREIDVEDEEREAHQLAGGAPRLQHVPHIPRTSDELGESEAEWAARLFEAAARLARTPADRSRWLRLSLAPWVVLERWSSLDSAAQALLAYAPNDSAVLPARALAAYRRMKRPVLESPPVSVLFDAVLTRLPRVDSARYDSFDGVLSADDDEWRYGLFPDQQVVIEQRGWSIIDPLWSTPVNEIGLARRARVAEADYRYADLARDGEAGSETPLGRMLLRQGAPSASWKVMSSVSSRYRLQRSWRSMEAISEIDQTPYTWRVFYGQRFTPRQASLYELSTPCTAHAGLMTSLYDCATSRPADWREVPFYGRTASIDVTIARFRARGDSADVYIGARIPLRTFKSRLAQDAHKSDRVVVGLRLNTENGLPMFHDSVTRELPAPNLLAWTHQWTKRVGPSRMMHRVEAMEPSQPSGARGVARFTSDAQVAFPLKGFGMSDVLVAATATPKRNGARRLRDLTIAPNGGTVAPAERFAMVWEVYDLTPGPDGRVRWRVRIKREQGALLMRSDMKEALSGAASAGSRVLANESSASDLSFVRDANGGETVLDNIVFGLGAAPVGHHVVNVTIEDLVSRKSVMRGVSVRVLDPNTQRRGTSPDTR